MKSQTSYIMSFDTSTPSGKCALLSATGNAEEALLTEEIRISKTLLPQIAALLNSKNISPGTIQAIGVSIGPGTFTGLRVGLSCAKGLSLGLKRPLYGFSSLEIMAMDTLLHAPWAQQESPDYFLPYRDARHGEMFTALFRISQNPRRPLASRLLRVQADEIVTRDEFRLPEDGHTLIVGKKEELPETLAPSVSGGAIIHHEMDSSAIAAAWLTRRAIENQTSPSDSNVTLNYCRKPQAQTKWADLQG